MHQMDQFNFSLVGFNGMSTCIDLSYALRLENRVHCTFIFILFIYFCLIVMILATRENFLLKNLIIILQSTTSPPFIE